MSAPADPVATPGAPSSKCIVVSGMHRSGTSMVASLLAESGVNVGSQLVPPSHGNPRGHFEDFDFYVLHERWLEARGASAFQVPDGFRAELTDEEEAEARRTVDARAGIPLWGFKDPRAALFLPEWERLLPNACFLFVYRHPIEVALSLVRRGIDLDVARDPSIAIRAWIAYNRRILEFHRTHRARTALWSITGATRSLSTALESIAVRFGLPLRRDACAVFAPGELHQGLLAPEIDWPSIVPEALALHRELEACADLPAGDDGHSVDGSSRPTANERGSGVAIEYLLSASLTRGGEANQGATQEGLPHLRVDFSRFRLEIAHKDVELDQVRAELARLHEALSSLREEMTRLRGERSVAEDERAQIEQSRGMRLLRSWWSTKAAATRVIEGARRRLGS